MKYKYQSDIGVYRKNNEDIAWAGKNNFNQYMCLICDGVGGEPAGEVVSKITSDIFINSFIITNFANFLANDFVDFKEWCKNNLNLCKEKIRDNVFKNPNNKGMCTTLVFSIVVDNQILTFNCGDSRCYFVKDQKVRQISVDHNVYNMLIKSKASEEKFESFKNQFYLITSCVSDIGDKEILFDIFVNNINDADYIVTSSDGFFNFAHSNELASVYIYQDLNLFLKAMIDKAIKNKSNDNISLSLLQLK